MTFEIICHFPARILEINEMCIPRHCQNVKLSLNKGMEEFKCSEGFSFRMQKLDPCETTIVVNKSYKVFVL